MNKSYKNFKKEMESILKLIKWGKEHNYYLYMRNLESACGPTVRVRGKEMLMFGSNNYLGLTSHPKVKEAAITAIKKYGVGSGGVRLLSGTYKLHETMEEEIAKFKGAETAVAFSTGFMTNSGVIPKLITDESVIINDEKNHASIVDGCKASGAEIRVFLHNNMEKLENILKFYPSQRDKLVIVDGVYSMDGDIANLPVIYKLAKRYCARIMIDEAHATGVLGKSGRGTPEYFNMIGKIDIVMGTLSKALGGLGGFIASNKEVVTYLKHATREFIFTTSLPPAISAGVIAAIKVIKEEPQLLKNLWRNIDFMRDGLIQIGYDTGNTQSAVIPVIIKDDIKTYKLARLVHEMGIFVNPIVFPAVKKKESRIRINMMATHSLSNLERALESFRKAGKRLGIIWDNFLWMLTNLDNKYND